MHLPNRQGLVIANRCRVRITLRYLRQGDAMLQLLVLVLHGDHVISDFAYDVFKLVFF